MMGWCVSRTGHRMRWRRRLGFGPKRPQCSRTILRDDPSVKCLRRLKYRWLPRNSTAGRYLSVRRAARAPNGAPVLRRARAGCKGSAGNPHFRWRTRCEMGVLRAKSGSSHRTWATRRKPNDCSTIKQNQHLAPLHTSAITVTCPGPRERGAAGFTTMTTS